MIFTYTAAFFFPLPDAEPAFFFIYNQKAKKKKELNNRRREWRRRKNISGWSFCRHLWCIPHNTKRRRAPRAFAS
jgi:hypothetical protein